MDLDSKNKNNIQILDTKGYSMDQVESVSVPQAPEGAEYDIRQHPHDIFYMQVL